MKVVYMGTPAFACPALTALHESRHEIKAVVTGPDKPVGRGHRLTPTAVKSEALKRGLKVFTPTSLKSRGLRESLAALQVDLFVVVAFRILPESLFAVPKLGSVNVHGSLLPKYRGAAPINWALINGETETGLSIFYLKKSVDTGDVIAQTRLSIEPDDTYDTLSGRMALAAGPFLVETLDLIEANRAKPVPQDDSEASGAPKLTPADGHIDFGFPAELVCNFVRGLSSKPGAYTHFRGKQLKILGCRPADDIELPDHYHPGRIVPDKKRLLAACARSVVELTRVVPQGKKEMDGPSFRNGFRPTPADVFGLTVQGESKTS
jgi:methionyl-tRNA formyltransferase